MSPGRPAEVRTAEPEDARRIAEVRVASWRWAYRDQLPDALLSGLSVEGSETGWRTVLARDDVDVVVAVRAGDVVGFASAGGSRDENAERDVGEVFTIYLLAEEAGTGTGDALLEAAEDALRGRGFARATLWTLETNARARRFYERHGWSWDGSTGAHQVECANLPVVRYATDL